MLGLEAQLETDGIGFGNISTLATFSMTAFSFSTARSFILSVRHSKTLAEGCFGFTKMDASEIAGIKARVWSLFA